MTDAGPSWLGVLEIIGTPRLALVSADFGDSRAVFGAVFVTTNPGGGGGSWLIADGAPQTTDSKVNVGSQLRLKFARHFRFGDCFKQKFFCIGHKI